MTPSAFMDPHTLQSRMRSVDRYLRNRVEREERSSRDLSMSATDRRNSISAANNIRNFLEVLGVPQENDAASTTPAPAPARPQGVPINTLSDEDMQRIRRYMQ